MMRIWLSLGESMWQLAVTGDRNPIELSAATDRAKDKSDGQCDSDAKQRAFDREIARDSDDIGGAGAKLGELVGAFFLHVAGEILQVTLGLVSVDGRCAGQVTGGINGGLLELGDILPTGRERRGNSRFVGHSNLKMALLVPFNKEKVILG